MCGLAGVYGVDNLPIHLTQLMIETIEPRGNGKGAGLALSTSTGFDTHRMVGAPRQVLTTLPFANTRSGTVCVAHHRYGTSTGNADTVNVQPFKRKLNGTEFVLLHNGSIPGDGTLREQLGQFEGFDASSDSEIISLLIAQGLQKGDDFHTAVVKALRQLSSMTCCQAAYALIVATKDHMVIACDPQQHRPLCYGKVGDGWAIASETAALDAVFARDLTHVRGGEAVTFSENGIHSEFFWSTISPTNCVVETLYLSKHQSKLWGNPESVGEMRRRVGMMLSKHYMPPDEECADTILVPVPASAIPLAEGYHEVTGLPFVLAIAKSIFAGRSFLQNTQAEITEELETKFYGLAHLFAGKHIILVDDSVIRGSTMKYIAELLMKAGAESVVILSGLPQVVEECHKGVYIRKRADGRRRLLADIHDGDLKAMAEELGVRQIVFCSREDMKVIAPVSTLCMDCLGGQPDPLQITG